MRQQDGAALAALSIVLLVGSAAAAAAYRPPPVPSPDATLSVAPSEAVAVVAGDVVRFRLSLTTNHVWPVGSGASLFVTLPGNDGVYEDGRVDRAFELVATTPSQGSCRGEVFCEFPALGPDATAVVDLTLRAADTGSFRLRAQALSHTVDVPVHVVRRSADLALAIEPPRLVVRVGKRATLRATVTNNGPHPVADAVVTLRFPVGLAAWGAVDGRACARGFSSLRCGLPPLASGGRASLLVVARASRSLRGKLRIATSSDSAVDAVPGNSRGVVPVDTHAAHRPKLPK